MPAQTPSASASPTVSKRDKRRNRFFEAISTAPRAEQAQSSQQSKQRQSASQSKPDKAHDAKPNYKHQSSLASTSATPMELAFKLSPEASKLFDKVTMAGPNCEDAVQRLMKVIRADLEVSPTSLPNGSIMNPEHVLQAISASARMAQAANTRGSAAPPPEGFSIDISLHDLIKTPRETLSPAMQKAQDDMLGVEELRAKTDMPLSNDPKVSKRYINNLLRVNGEAPFPFDQLTEYRDPNSELGRYVRYDLPARAYMTDLQARKPDLADVISNMLQVYQRRAVAYGGHIKTAA